MSGMPPEWRGHLMAAGVIVAVFGAAALTVYLISGAAGGFSLAGGGHLIYLIALLALVSSSVLLGRRVGLGYAARAILFWAGLGALVLLIYELVR